MTNTALKIWGIYSCQSPGPSNPTGLGCDSQKVCAIGIPSSCPPYWMNANEELWTGGVRPLQTRLTIALMVDNAVISCSLPVSQPRVDVLTHVLEDCQVLVDLLHSCAAEQAMTSSKTKTQCATTTTQYIKFWIHYPAIVIATERTGRDKRGFGVHEHIISHHIQRDKHTIKSVGGPITRCA
ncbi:hypothetical protein BDV26DRAFT_263796 [Aspergillus bertholletiae]|uniref:Uncharacterized protein n=1 Tax=Aspergillus bertholletiae TaxID=1226010 RepID=A0A5N7B5L4_9EURO|nr:hypothetical protein BDV26DRAFT_263796 [Aspergillus bertholletiae]